MLDSIVHVGMPLVVVIGFYMMFTGFYRVLNLLEQIRDELRKVRARSVR